MYSDIKELVVVAALILTGCQMDASPKITKTQNAHLSSAMEISTSCSIGTRRRELDLSWMQSSGFHEFSLRELSSFLTFRSRLPIGASPKFNGGFYDDGSVFRLVFKYFSIEGAPQKVNHIARRYHLLYAGQEIYKKASRDSLLT